MVPTSRLLGPYLAILACGVLVAGCTEGSPPAQDAQATAESEAQLSDVNVLLLAATRVALPPAGVTPADLPEPESNGAQALARFCTKCHVLPHPASHSATDWPVVVRRMWMRIDKVAPAFDVPNPAAGERVVMLRYLETHALKVTTASLPDLPGRDAFTTTCTRCHELPDPAQHSSNDWVAVVDRMSRRMREMLGEVPAREQLQRIEIYLQQASRQRAR